MLPLRFTIFRFAPVVALFLASCATYNQQVSKYYSHYRAGDYEKASAALDDSRLLSKRRNHLLFLLEKGRMEHLLHHFDASNRFFNEADDLMEAGHGTAADLAKSTLLNPMMETYRGEDFEKYMVHYYKALNYLMLNQPGEALVEARRISLRTYAQEDAHGEHTYAQDAFSFMLQGLIYEKNKDVNNAFIAYRNAVDLYLKNGGSYYGVSMPLQLKKDLLRTAEQMGFADQVAYYERELNYTLQPEDRAGGAELVLFWEAGTAPVKEEEDIVFFLSNQGGQFFFTSANGSIRVPFDRSVGGLNESNLASLTSIRAALPRYELQASLWQSGEVQADSNSHFLLEPAQNINDLAQATLRERRLRDLSKTLSRIAVGKLAELAAAPASKPNGKEETESEKRDRRNRELISAGLKVFNFAREKADTRNWQSLPGSIYYTRVPLRSGQQTVKVSLHNSWGEKTYELPLEGSAGLSFRNISTL